MTAGNRKKSRRTRKSPPVPPAAALAAVADPIDIRQQQGWEVRTLFFTLMLLLLSLAWRNISDLDFGIHLAGGRWIVQNGTFPSTDPFSYTVPDHPYIAYHWLFQVLLYLCHQAGGAVGVALLRSAILLAVFLIMMDVLRMRRIVPWVSGMIALSVILAVEWRFMLRPELFSYLCLAATIWIFEKQRNFSRAPLLLLPVVQLVWVNTHIYILGWFVIGAYVLEEFIKRRKLPAGLLKALLWCIPALLLNPYHVHAVAYPLELFTRMRADNIYAQHISELASPFAVEVSTAFPFTLAMQFGLFKLILAVGVLALVIHLYRRSWSDSLLLVVFGALSFLAIRNIPLFLITCIPALAGACSHLALRVRRPKIGCAVMWAVSIISVAMTARVVSGTHYAVQRRPVRMQARVSDLSLPVAAADWLVKHDLQGPGFNNLNAGSTLMWRDQKRKHFIDGRNEVFGDAFFSHYLQVMDPAQWAVQAERYGFEYVFLTHRDAMPLVRRIANDQGWRPVYADGTAVIFVRSGGMNDAVLQVGVPSAPEEDARWEFLRAISPDGGMRERVQRWLWTRESAPGELFQYGTFLLAVGQLEGAEGPLLRAALESPNFYETSNNLGALYHRRKQWEAAIRCYSRVLILNPANRMARLRLLRAEQEFESELRQQRRERH